MEKVRNTFERKFTVYTLDWRHKSINWKDKSVPGLSNKCGLYQIYGDSRIYGRDVLLYIGQSKDLGGRLHEHLRHRGIFSRQGELKVRVASLNEGDLNAIESILIAMHKPCENSSSLLSLHPDALVCPIFIRNYGNRGALMLEVTNSYFWELNASQTKAAEKRIENNKDDAKTVG